MKVRELRATLEAFGLLFSDCNRLPEVEMLKQLDGFLKDYETSTVSSLVDRIRTSRLSSAHNRDADSLSN